MRTIKLPARGLWSKLNSLVVVARCPLLSHHRSAAGVRLCCSPRSRDTLRPNRASAAECGEYVHHPEPQHLRPCAADRIEGRATTPFAIPTTDTAESPARPKGPCSGPNCSGRPDHHPAPLAPVPTSGPHAKEVAQLHGAVAPSDGASSRLGDFISPRPIRRASSVFHPPRLV